MSNTKMLQMVLDGQTSIKKDLAEFRNEVKNGFQAVNKRLDTIGSSVAYLEVEKLERQVL